MRAPLLQKGSVKNLSHFSLAVRIRTNNPLERIMREIRWRTFVVGAFPDGNSALMLVGARLRHIARTKWGLRRYLNMEPLENSNWKINLLHD